MTNAEKLSELAAGLNSMAALIDSLDVPSQPSAADLDFSEVDNAKATLEMAIVNLQARLFA